MTRSRVFTGAAAAALVVVLAAGCWPTPEPPSPGPTVVVPWEPETKSPAPQPEVPPTPEPAPEPTPVVPEPVAPPTLEPAPVPPPVSRPPDTLDGAATRAQLRRGDSGAQVVELQQRLVDLGYFVPAVDGVFGYGTQQAVWALQKAAVGLDRDGVVGPETWAALDAGVVPAARTQHGHVIEVDLDRQLVLAVDDGVVTKVVNASSGNGERYTAQGRTHLATTPRGYFAVGRQVDGPYESSMGLGAMYRPKFFTGGYAVHGSPDIPPYPASHGCIRVHNAAMDWIWDAWTAPRGTAVVIY